MHMAMTRRAAPTNDDLHRRGCRAQRWPLLLVLMLACTACSGVPLGTMWKLRSFGADDFAKLAPEEVRVAIQVDEALGLDAQRTTLDVAVTDAKGERTMHHIPLRQMASGRSVGHGLRGAGAGRQWHLLQVAPEGLEEMRSLQRRLLDRGEESDKGALEIQVGAAFLEDARPEVSSTAIELHLRLDADDGFFKLFGGRVDLGGASAATAAPAPEQER